MIHYNQLIPVPEVYIKSVIQGKLQRTKEDDPRSILKLRNNGGVMNIDSIELKSKDKAIESFSSVLGTKSASPYEVCTESTSSLSQGCKNVCLNTHSSIEICTIRPKDGHEKSSNWEEVLHNDVKDKTLTVTVNFHYLFVPFVNKPIFRATKAIQVY